MSLFLKYNDIEMQLTLNNFNPWWVDSKIPPALTGKSREAYKQLESSLPLRQMTIISGLRRVGKTTLIFQLIDHLLSKEKVSPYKIFYYSFDESRFRLDELLEYYETIILKSKLSYNKKKYLFLDEIQKLKDWQNKVKMIYDLNPNVKLVLSGSANLLVKQHSRESLAGRFFDYTINPLSFKEYLFFKKIQIDFSRENIFRQILISSLDAYIKCGGFVESIDFDEALLLKYFNESILERVLYRDIQDVFPRSNPAILYKLLKIFAQFPGYYLEYKNLSNDLKIDQRTTANYIGFLEYSILTRKVYNYSPNLITSEKKMKRIYLSNTGFTYALNNGQVDLSLLVEQFWINDLDIKFFHRSPQKDEVDAILVKDTYILPVEIKLKNSITGKDLRALFKFMRKHQVSKGLMISLQTESFISKDNKQVFIIPYWKYQAIKSFINNFRE